MNRTGARAVAQRHRKENRRQAAQKRSDVRKARTNNWDAEAERARQALQANSLRLEAKYEKSF